MIKAIDQTEWTKQHPIGTPVTLRNYPENYRIASPAFTVPQKLSVLLDNGSCVELEEVVDASKEHSCEAK